MKPDWKSPETVPLDTVVLVDCDDGVCAGRCSVGYHGDKYWMPHPTSRESDALYDVKAWAELPEGA